MINLLSWLFLAVVWGTTWAAVKVGLETLSPLIFCGVRFAFAGTFLLCVASARRRVWPSPAQWPLIFGTAAIGVAVPYGLQFWGQQHIASGLAAVLTATIPLMVMLMAHWSLPDEPLTPRKLFGAALGLIGVALIFSDQFRSEGALALLGGIALVIGAISSSRSQVWIKQQSRDLDPLKLATWQMLLGSLPLMTLGWILERDSVSSASWPLDTIMAMTYLAIFGSALAFLVLYRLLRRMAVTKVLTVLFANPIVAMLLGWVWFDEVLSPWAIAGAISILVGLWFILAAVEGERPTTAAPGVTTGVFEKPMEIEA